MHTQTWPAIVAQWAGMGSSRQTHLFVRSISDPLLFGYFGMLTDQCWRRSLAASVPQGGEWSELMVE